MTALAATAPSMGPVALLLLFGVLVTFAGHLTTTRWAIVLGILILFGATLLMFVQGFGAYQQAG